MRAHPKLIEEEDGNDNLWKSDYCMPLHSILLPVKNPYNVDNQVLVDRYVRDRPNDGTIVAMLRYMSRQKASELICANSRRDHGTALHMAARLGREAIVGEMLKYLTPKQLEIGYDDDVNEKSLVLHNAIGYGQVGVVHLLLDKMSLDQILIPQIYWNNRHTALHFAAEFGLLLFSR
jgi:hypothetical protein